jgi:Peptidase propeptide and YPEB domain
MLAAALAGAADAQMRQGRGFGGGFGRDQAREFRGGPFRGPMPYRPPPPGSYRPPPRGPYRLPPPGPYRPPPGANSLGADRREQQDEARQGVRGGQLAPLGRVIQEIGRRAPGRQLDTGIEYRGDRPVYRVRWVTAHGRRVDYMVDAATGAILDGR